MNPLRFVSLDETTSWIFSQLPDRIAMALPLGLGKPNPLVNAIYDRIVASPERRLEIYTALSLAIPEVNGDLQSRFMDPFIKRHFGEDYPELHYLKDLAARGLPANVAVHEFYVPPGKTLTNLDSQRNYISVNYTHVQYVIAERGVNLMVQMIARNPKDPNSYSLSCNPDLTLDIKDLYQKNGKRLILVGVVHPDLPFCGGDAVVSEDLFDAIVDAPEMNHQLFASPRQSVSDTEFMIGLHASLMIEDGGSLQIGIGALADALVYCTVLRHEQNELYRELTDQLLAQRSYARWEERFSQTPFEEGLYGTSEMVMDGFMHLRRAGVLKREVHEVHTNIKRYLHGAFFLGSREFYEWLRELNRSGDTGLSMTRVSLVNDLYDDADELALRRQRVKARFFNTTMKATLLGGAASETNEKAQAVSGVGGQYNFVAMSHELQDSFSVLMLKSVRHSHGERSSNFVWGQGHLTISRHLRDVVISEYGVAFLKNRTDEEAIQASLAICDSQFQDPLRQQAVDNFKLSPEWQIPSWARHNSSGWTREFLAPWKKRGLFPNYPFGSDFTRTEERLVIALKSLKAAGQSKIELFKLFRKGYASPPSAFEAELERMNLHQPKTWRESMTRLILLGALGGVEEAR